MRSGPRSFGSIAFVAVSALAGCAFQAAPEEAAKSAALDDFAKRVGEYAELYRMAAGQLPKLPSKASPEQIRAHESSLADALIAARPNAKQGDFFTPSVQPLMLAIIRQELKGLSGKDNRKVVADDNATTKAETPVNIKLAVNKPYPDGVSLSTVPPDMLKKLPRLPEELEYRFAGRHLILRAVTAKLILDFIPNALPPIPRNASN